MRRSNTPPFPCDDNSRIVFSRRRMVAAGVCVLAEAGMNAQAAQPSKASKIAIASAPLKPDRIEAKDIISGNPQAGDLVFSKSEDSKETRGIWSCTPGSFRWTFDTDETATILEGQVTVQMADGTTLELKPGDLAFFPRGQKSVWTVKEKLRKVYVLYH
jgi:uncharacterized cupin superfamily protein